MQLRWLMPLLFAVACGPGTGTKKTPPPPKPSADKRAPKNPLSIPAGDKRLSKSPRVMARVLSSPHGYFRFINIAFSEQVCQRFDALLPELPSVNLHGDAHVEQYSISEAGRGLSDFDDSSTGPAVLDLVRVAVSLRLTAQMNGWGDHAEGFVTRFLRGYREGLGGAGKPEKTPEVATRAKRSFVQDRNIVLERATDLMRPLGVPKARIQAAIDEYSRPILKQNNLTKEFFRVKRAGELLLGIGSALDTKYLVRVEGATTATEDDVILEIKEVRDLSGISCIVSRKSDPFRVLVGQARLAYQPFRYPGYVRVENKTFWVHAWVDNYVQLSVEQSFRTPEEVREIAFDMGRQLGRGHPNLVAEPMGPQLRQALQDFVAKYESKIRGSSADLAKETIQAYWSFANSL